MKNFNTISFGILILLFITMGCSEGRKVNNELEDSERIADSIAQIEAVRAAEAAEQARLDSIRQDSIENTKTPTFQTFCYPYNVDGIVTLQDFYKASHIEKSLKNLGFKLEDTKKETRETYDGEDVYTVILKSFIKTMGDKTITVTFDNDDNHVTFVEILFPNLEQVEKFKSTVKGKLSDDRVPYWATKINYSGTKVTIKSDGSE